MRSGNQKNKTVRRLEAFYDELDLKQRETLRRSDSILDAVEQGDAEATFKKGDALTMARRAVGDGNFRRWCSLKWAYDRAYAYRFMLVAENLAPFRERLVAARVDRVSLMDLAKRPDLAEALLLSFEAGKRLTNAQVKQLVKNRQSVGEAAQKALVSGGLAGLQAMHAGKKAYLCSLAYRFRRLASAVESAIAAPRVVEAEFAAAVLQEAQWARAELHNLCLFIEPSCCDASKPLPAQLPEDSGWYAVDQLLHRLGKARDWPGIKQMKGWLRNDVLPLLLWAAGDRRKLEPPQIVKRTSNAEGSPPGASKVAQARLLKQPQAIMPPRIGNYPELSRMVGLCASFLTILRERHLAVGGIAEDVEANCQMAAEALTLSFEKIASHGASATAAKSIAGRLADVLYRKSLLAQRLIPLKGFQLPTAEKKARRTRQAAYNIVRPAFLSTVLPVIDAAGCGITDPPT